jgi:hypothetical protein
VSRNGLFEPFINKNEHFAKTGSGQTGKTQKRTVFAQAFAPLPAAGVALDLSVAPGGIDPPKPFVPSVRLSSQKQISVCCLSFRFECLLAV